MTNKHTVFFTDADVALIREKARRAKVHAPAFVFLIAVVMGFYWASLVIPPGWITYSISAVCLVIIAITSLARLDDIGSMQTSKRWQTRRAGFILSLAGAGMIGFDPLVAIFIHQRAIHFPTWNETMIYMGVACAWVTTPGMPPWWRYISGQYRTEREARLAAVKRDKAEYESNPLLQEPESGSRVAERRSGVDRRKAKE